MDYLILKTAYISDLRIKNNKEDAKSELYTGFVYKPLYIYKVDFV